MDELTKKIIMYSAAIVKAVEHKSLLPEFLSKEILPVGMPPIFDIGDKTIRTLNEDGINVNTINGDGDLIRTKRISVNLLELVSQVNMPMMSFRLNKTSLEQQIKQYGNQLIDSLSLEEYRLLELLLNVTINTKILYDETEYAIFFNSLIYDFLKKNESLDKILIGTKINFLYRHYINFEDVIVSELLNENEIYLLPKRKLGVVVERETNCVRADDPSSRTVGLVLYKLCGMFVYADAVDLIDRYEIIDRNKINKFKFMHNCEKLEICETIENKINKFKFMEGLQ
jgi:hypothetical protein